MTAITRQKPTSKMNSLAGPSSPAASRPRPIDSRNCSPPATVGVPRLGCTVATARGSAPARAMPYHMRVATFCVARLAAITEVNMANSANHQATPQTRCAMTSAGSSADPGSLGRVAQPQPMTWPQMTTTVITPVIAIDAIVAIGTLRRGWPVSSASGTADSQPVSPCTENTIASMNPEAVARWPGLKLGSKVRNVKPPGPGLASPDSPSASTIRNSRPPSTTIVRTESLMPKYQRTAITG